VLAFGPIQMQNVNHLLYLASVIGILNNLPIILIFL
jgi:hypothetical protein